jgi:hypothetical protein
MRALCAALSVAGLAACSTEKAPEFPPLCPQAGILRDGADITQFRGTGTDLTDMVLDGRITAVGGKCSLDDSRHLRVKMSVQLDLTRGPAATAHTINVLYFVSVSKGQDILAKKIYGVAAEFPGNTDHLRLNSQEIDLVLPIDEKTTGDAYSTLVSFQLTPEQLAFNRSRGVR